jgi:hypothetical protein
MLHVSSRKASGRKEICEVSKEKNGYLVGFLFVCRWAKGATPPSSLASSPSPFSLSDCSGTMPLQAVQITTHRETWERRDPPRHPSRSSYSNLDLSAIPGRKAPLALAPC